MNNKKSPISNLQSLFALFMVFTGFALRLNLIEKRPLHFDEGINVYFASLTLPELLQAHIANADTDPPAHRITLGWWAGGAGLSPFSIRLCSVFFSVLSMALLYRVARTLRLSQTASLLAVVLMALSPYAIYYAQEAKGYAMAAAMALASWWAWMRLRERVSGYGMWGIYWVSTALMLGTHFYTAPVLVMQWVWWFLTQGRPTTKAVAGRLALQAAVCVPVGIWALLALQAIVAGSFGVSTGMSSLSLPALLQLVFGEMAVSRPANEPGNVFAAGVLAAALCIGGLSLWRRNRSAFWFGATCLVPLVFTAALTLRISFFSPRFLLFALPNMLVLTSGAASSMGARRLFHKTKFPLLLASPLLCLLIFISGLLTFYKSAIDPVSEYRLLFASMRPLVKPGDGALGTYIWMRGMMMSYAPDAAEKLSWHMDFASPSNAAQVMPPVAQQHSRLWTFNFAGNPDSPETASAQWLRENEAYAGRFVAGDMSVLLFADAPAIRPSIPQTNTQSVTFDKRIHLRVQAQCPKDAPDISAGCAAQPGDVLPVLAEWTALAFITDDLSISLQLVQPDGQLAAQNDSAAVNGLAPSFTWKENQPVIDRRAVLIPSTLGAGRYTLRLGLYRRSDGARLKTETGAEFVELGVIQIR